MKKNTETRDVLLGSMKYINGKTLDFGAGNAKYKKIILNKASEYVAFDVVSSPNIDVVGDILKAPFENESFDSIISTQVLEHVEKPWIMVKEIARILKKNGYCFLTAPFMIPYHADPHDYFRYSKEGLKSLFKNENFEIIECNQYGATFTTLSELIRFIFFNPYKRKNGRIATRFLRGMQKTASYFDRFNKNSLCYPNVYIVARKK